MMKLIPKKGQPLEAEEVVKICRQLNRHDMADDIEANPPARPFVFDGCSCWPDSWFGVDFSLACLEHDIEYWRGKRGDYAGRYRADYGLAVDISKLVGPIMAILMFWGVRIGGGYRFLGLKRMGFSWANGEK